MIELASTNGARPSDEGPHSATALRRKMAAYLANGAQLGWLLFPEQRAMEIWRAPRDGTAAEPAFAGPPEPLEPAKVLEGGEAFPGLRLELAEIWAV